MILIEISLFCLLECLCKRNILFLQTNRENYQGNETQLEIVQASDGQTAEVDISNQHQILITQGTGSGREEGACYVENRLFYSCVLSCLALE